MARVHTQKKNRGGNKIECGRCNAVIKVGDIYYSWKPRYGSKRVRCKDHYPRPSELTSSKMGEVWDAQQDAYKDIQAASTGSELADAIQICIDAADSVKDEYESSRSNMPDHLQDVGSGAEMQEKIDALEEWINSLENTQSDVNDFEVDFSDKEIVKCDDGEREETDEECSERQLENIRNTAQSVIDELSV